MPVAPLKEEEVEPDEVAFRSAAASDAARAGRSAR